MTALSASFARRINYQTTLLKKPLQVTISIENSLKTAIDFNVFGESYSFVITTWQTRGFIKYAKLFHKAINRDVHRYGFIFEESANDSYRLQCLENMQNVISHPDGTSEIGSDAKPMTFEQKLNIIEHMSKDILSCLDLIGNIHTNAIIDYCVWYVDQQGIDDTYECAITKLTSHSVVQGHFIARNANRELVEFRVQS